MNVNTRKVKREVLVTCTQNCIISYNKRDIVGTNVNMNLMADKLANKDQHTKRKLELVEKPK